MELQSPPPLLTPSNLDPSCLYLVLDLFTPFIDGPRVLSNNIVTHSCLLCYWLFQPYLEDWAFVSKQTL